MFENRIKELRKVKGLCEASFEHPAFLHAFHF